MRKAASKLLGISFRSLRYRLEKHAIDLAGDDESEDEPPSGSMRAAEGESH